MKESIDRGEVPARIAFVFCNREQGQDPQTDLFLEQVRSYGIPLLTLSSRRFREGLDPERRPEWRLHYDREVMRRLEAHPVDLVVLAGYMLIVGPEMCHRYTMVNLHPALPGGPKGTWREVIWQLIQERAERTGAMMHLVTPELDEGPPVTYCGFSLRGEPFERHWDRLEREGLEAIRAAEGEGFELFKLIREHELKREFPLIVRTVKAFAEGRVRVNEGRPADAAGRPIAPYDLSAEIDEIVGPP